MILQLALYHSKKTACFFAVVFYCSGILSARGAIQSARSFSPMGSYNHFNTSIKGSKGSVSTPSALIPAVSKAGFGIRPELSGATKEQKDNASATASAEDGQPFIGGPSQPEMSSFQSVGTDKLVNLFTGDFNYNIPLLSVGDYPVNIYYTGDISAEQEAGWVGLGWNINPGNINRNTRGVPDDFNGSDTLVQTQAMKPNKTWGVGVGVDFELMGKKDVFSVGASANLGVSFNNYLGPSLDLAVSGNVSQSMSKSAATEKYGAAVSANVGIDINSRGGTSFTGGVSLSANAKSQDNKASFGLGLSTGYNSRSGIKALQISEQHSFSSRDVKQGVKKKTNEDGTERTYGYGSLKGINQSIYSTSISFVKPSYIPSMRMPLTNTAWAGRFQLGGGSFGVAVDIEAEVYGQTSEIASEDRIQQKPMVGYLYYQNAANNPNAIMDFTRYNDREVTPSTPVISVPQYSYDVFSLQGEGTGGSVRAYRNDLGYVRDNTTSSKDKSLGIGVDIDPPGHYGANINRVKTPSFIGEWGSGNKLRSAIAFTTAGGTYENVYFRNPGENAVIDDNRFSRIGGADLVRFALGGSGQSPTIEPKLQVFDKGGKPTGEQINLAATPALTTRNKRTQVTSFLSAGEAAAVGLDKMIKSYDNQNFIQGDTLAYESIPRVDGTVRKAHHISQITTTESSGKRYIYGIPVYNLVQKDFTFSVDAAYNNNELPDRVGVTAEQKTENSLLLKDNAKKDGYVQITSTPGYAHSFLLSGILSPDYVDVTGNGITEDDLGDGIKFNYTRIKSGGSINYKWRTPLSSGDYANFNGAVRSETKDDKGIIAYGEREQWYLQSVESKTMIALFYVSARTDGKGAASENGNINSGDDFVKKLDKISLFSKADIKKNGLAKAKPVKTVHLEYSYELCQNTPDNPGGASGAKGKLTLKSIYFTYNGKNKAFKNKYIFSYGQGGEDNPAYATDATDRWGTYKPYTQNPSGLKNSDYPYSVQDKNTADKNAGAWMLKKIILPAGGKIDIKYESDDYAFVQNKRAAAMMPVVGFGSANNYNTKTDGLYPINPAAAEFYYVFIKVPQACATVADVYNKYLQGQSQLAFKIWVIMPKGPEYIPCYANFGTVAGTDYGFVSGQSDNIIWVKMKDVGGKSPLSVTTLEYLRQQLPGQAFEGYDVSESAGLEQIGKMLEGMLSSLKNAFTDPINAFRKDRKALHTTLEKCFVRLNDPDGFKYGGGHRVKSVTLSDNWDKMTQQYAATYGQEYDYTTTEMFNGIKRTISSGVASYEPSIGGEENPWQTIKQIEDKLPLGPTSYGAVEMPVLDAFFGAAVVGYGKVTVSSIKKATATAQKSRSGMGRQVTEFYTAKDYPVYYSYTPFDAASVKEYHQSSTLAFAKKYAYDYKAQSQGFLVVNNDMHGKIKSESSYAENDPDTKISYTENFYRNTGENGMDDKFVFIDKEQKGAVTGGNMGIDVELMTDTREFSVKGHSDDVQGQVDIFYFGPFVIPIPTMWGVIGKSENIYRAVTTTKVVSYHSVLDSIVVIDKGSMVSTKNLAYDAYTGAVLVSRTNNEFNQAIYNTSYPAHWAYSGMGLAYKNIDAVYSGVSFTDGKVTAGIGLQEMNAVIESGDELYIINPGSVSASCAAPSSADIKLLWAFDGNKPASSLTNPAPDFVFMDEKGGLYNRTGVSFKIIRSGHRNMLGENAATAVSMNNPLETGKLFFDAASKVINAAAVEFREKWQTDADVIQRLKLVKDNATCAIYEVADSTGTGYLEQSINPYRKGLLGGFRTYRSMVFYDGRAETDLNAPTNITQNGLLKSFKPYWDFNASNNLMPDISSTQWVWNTKLNKVNAKGLELETADALGIYTAAQYGYNKTMPVAITNNARYSEMFAEGFEDYGYAASLSNTKFNYGKKHIDFTKMSGTAIINSDTSALKAHSGKLMMKLNAGATGSVSVPVSLVTDDYTMPMKKDTTKTLNNLGGNYTYTPTLSIATPHVMDIVFGSSNFSLIIEPIDSFYYSGGTEMRIHYYSFRAEYYINITTAAIYNFKIGLSTLYNNSGVTVLNHSNGFTATIYDSVGNIVITSPSLAQMNFQPVNIFYSVSLCPGIYKIVNQGGEMYVANRTALNYTRNQYEWQCTNCTSPDYKNLDKTTGCTYTKPIAATDSVLNPSFSLTPQKQMLFSAWVKEDCGNAANGEPCKAYTYTHNQVQIKFPGSSSNDVTLTPTGPIIDGWQRYEGVFTPPANASSMNLNFVNSSTKPVYFDDIRMHPFNANMKSYVYDPTSLRLNASLDANNYATFYEYDEEGTLIRTKAETREGIKTVSETRSALQKIITEQNN